ncbi:hypothetical protein F4820DRAFT_333931 [Hypoxylon rubiginosum]|uniref:Uncharacterized protein n=1 Tax=Hypoxylon rubiginosum TaxID=110542 RepID=A0ACB9YYX9_9PEZI|nr:hypothetical protein F4820DRAFT_333931 [Hypoxylon rubiginosum]
MPRPVETLDVALPADHPLKRPVSNRNKQAAQRIYQLWNVWPWKLFDASSPHMPTIWTDNLLDKLKTIALCTTLQHALRLLKANLTDSQQLSIAPLNAVIEACKESSTPHNPVVKNRKRKQGRTIVVQYGSDGYENHLEGTGSGHEDLEEETDEAEDDDDDDDDNEEIETYESRLRRRRSLIPSAHRARGNSLPSGYGLPRKSKVPPSKRPKHRHEQVSTPLYLANASSPPLAPASFPSPRPSAPAPSSMRRFDSEGPMRPPSLGGVASHMETAISQLSTSFQEKFHGAERTVDDARSQLRRLETRLTSSENELEDTKKDIAELEHQKSEMENTYGDLLGIEKEEEELASRRRELMMRRMTAHWRPSSSMASSEQPPSQPSLGTTRASDDLLAEINSLVTDRLQPLKEHSAAIRRDISNNKKEIEAVQAKIDASAINLNTKSDELIRWRGFSSDVQDALVRRGFAELAFMREFGQNNTSSRDHLYSGFPSTLYFSRAATASFPELNRDTGLAGSPETGSTPVSQAASNNCERDRRRESV